jgi:hypothetical protein
MTGIDKTPNLFIGYIVALISHGTGQSEINMDVHVLGADPMPVPAATVSVSLIRPDGTSETLSATTDQAGDASLIFTIFTYGQYVMSVESLQAEGYAYDPTMNIANSMVIDVGSAEGLAAVGSERINAFFQRLDSAIQSGDTSWLFNALHPAVLDLYGDEACQAQLAQAITNPFTSEVESVEEFGPWTWERDERSRLIENAYTIAVIRTPSGGAAEMQEAHLALREDGSLGWFTDCGEPLP